MAVQKEQILRTVLTQMAQEGYLYAPVGVSMRHVHLSQPDLRKLFGDGYQLQPMRDLVQPVQFAAGEQVTLEGPKGRLSKVRIIGPVRGQTQVELSRTDALTIGLKDVPVRMSGQLEQTPGIRVIGPAGEITLSQGVIVAARHLHLSSEQARAYHVHDGQVVSVRVGGERPGIFEQVICRTGEGHELEFHVDTDEANAFLLKNGDYVEILCSGADSAGKADETVFDPVRIAGKTVFSMTGRSTCRTDRSSLVQEELRTEEGEQVLELVTEQDINLASREGKDHVWRKKDALVTPAAADRASQLAVKIRIASDVRASGICTPGSGEEVLELVTAGDLNAAFRDDRKVLYCQQKAIITPAAMERIEETGIRIVRV